MPEIPSEEALKKEIMKRFWEDRMAAQKEIIPIIIVSCLLGILLAIGIISKLTP